MASLLSLLVCILAFSFVPTLAINCKGCTPLDTASFDKLLSKFKVSVVKFDVAYPYGDKHEEYAKFSLAAAEVEDLFVGEVGIKDYGDKDNTDLAERFKVKKEDFPVVILFKVFDNGKIAEKHRYFFLVKFFFLCICHKVFKNKNNNRIYLSLDLMVTSKQTISKRSFVKSLESICPDRVV